jgi:hypothetical protein
MGFSAIDARYALMECNWDPQRAIHHLLSSANSTAKQSFGTMMMAPPVEVMDPSSVTTTTTSTTKSKSNHTLMSTKNDQHPSVKSKKETKKKQITNTSTPTTNPSSFSKKKISHELQEKLKAQKSRLTMVILGHVDHGKSTLMGQVLVQTGVVDKRIVSKYEKQGKKYIYVSHYLLSSISFVG